jgi:hypothetical protein
MAMKNSTTTRRRFLGLGLSAVALAAGLACSPKRYATDKVAFYRNDSTNYGGPGGGVEVHYWLEKTTFELHREVESVSDPTTRVDKVVVGGVRYFKVDVQEPQVKISLLVNHIEIPIEVVGVAPQM